MFDWTDEAKAELKTRWQGGESASQIAASMHVPSRSSVIGKVHRMGLAFTQPHTRGRPPKPSPKRTTKFIAKPRPAAPQPVEPVLLLDILTDADIPIAQRVGILGLTESTCRWPVGTPGAGDFFYCGAEPIEGRVYCGRHCRRAYHRN